MVHIQDLHIAFPGDLEGILQEWKQPWVDGHQARLLPRVVFRLGRVDEHAPLLPVDVFPMKPPGLAWDAKPRVPCKAEEEFPLRRRASFDDPGDVIGRDVSSILTGSRATLQVHEGRGRDEVHLPGFLEHGLGIAHVNLGRCKADLGLEICKPGLGIVPRDGVEGSILAEVLVELGRGLLDLQEAGCLDLHFLPGDELLDEGTKFTTCSLVDESKPCEASKELVIDGIDPFKELVVHGKSQGLALNELIDPGLYGLGSLDADTSKAKCPAFAVCSVELDPLRSVCILAQA